MFENREAVSAQQTIDEATDALARKLKAIREPEMRRHTLVRFLTTTAAAEAVAILSLALARGRDGDPHGLVVADTLTATLTDTSLLSYDERASLYSYAKQHGQHTVARLLFGSSPQRVSAMAALPCSKIVSNTSLACFRSPASRCSNRRRYWSARSLWWLTMGSKRVATFS